MAKRPNLYTILGILRSASQEEVRRAYLKAVKKLHPDKNVGPGHTELFIEVQQAYEVLSDAQRRAEYDSTLPKEVEKPSIVNSEILLSRGYLPRLKDSQLVYAIINLTPSTEFDKQQNAPVLNLCLAIDCSTSMKGEKLDMVKNTAIELLKRLRPQDIISVVTFNDRAEIIIPATRQVDVRRSQVKIQMLQTSGGTEILHALDAAYREVLQYSNPKYVNHIIMLTDGHTYGDEEACYKLADQANANNISITGMGIGTEWNDTFLDKLSGITGSGAIFVQQPQDINRLLSEKVNRLNKVSAESIVFEYKAHADVDVNYAFRMSPEAGAMQLASPIHLGPLLYDEPFCLLMELRVAPSALAKAKTITLLSGELQISSSLSPTSIPAIPINFTLPISTEITQDFPPDAIVRALSKLTLYRMQERARLEASQGNYEKAEGQLKTLATRLLAQGERALAQTVLLEAENLAQKKSFSEGGEKQLKYGTRALLLPGEQKP